MKQHIDVKQWGMLSEEQQQLIIPWLIGTGNLTEKHYSRYWTIGKCIEFIRKYHQMDIYTVDNSWHVQLFDLDVAANDDISCIHEDGYGENKLINVLFDCVIWVIEEITYND